MHSRNIMNSFLLIKCWLTYVGCIAKVIGHYFYDYYFYYDYYFFNELLKLHFLSFSYSTRQSSRLQIFFLNQKQYNDYYMVKWKKFVCGVILGLHNNYYKYNILKTQLVICLVSQEPIFSSTFIKQLLH